MTGVAPPTIDLDGLLRRLHLPTVRRLYPDLVERAEADDMAYRDFLALLMAEEVAHRAQTRIQRCVHRAHFPFLKTIDEYDFTFQSAVRLSLLGSALSPEFITQSQSLVFSGPSGTGKTHLAIAIAYRAIQNGFDALFTTATALIEDLSTATRDGKLREGLPRYTHPAVLVIDEVGYLGYGPDAANVLFQVVNDRYLHHRPMIFTTNKPLAAWGRVLHDPDLAEAILDRVLERGRHIELRGRSYRTRHAPLDLTPGPEPPSPAPARISGNHRPEFPEPTIAVRCNKRSTAEAGIQRATPIAGHRPSSRLRLSISSLSSSFSSRWRSRSRVSRSCRRKPSRTGLIVGVGLDGGLCLGAARKTQTPDINWPFIIHGTAVYCADHGPTNRSRMAAPVALQSAGLPGRRSREVTPVDAKLLAENPRDEERRIRHNVPGTCPLAKRRQAKGSDVGLFGTSGPIVTGMTFIFVREP